MQIVRYALMDLALPAPMVTSLPNKNAEQNVHREPSPMQIMGNAQIAQLVAASVPMLVHVLAVGMGFILMELNVSPAKMKTVRYAPLDLALLATMATSSSNKNAERNVVLERIPMQIKGNAQIARLVAATVPMLLLAPIAWMGFILMQLNARHAQLVVLIATVLLPVIRAAQATIYLEVLALQVVQKEHTSLVQLVQHAQPVVYIAAALLLVILAAQATI